jgi:hypothetical protein
MSRDLMQGLSRLTYEENLLRSEVEWVTVFPEWRYRSTLVVTTSKNFYMYQKRGRSIDFFFQMVGELTATGTDTDLTMFTPIPPAVGYVPFSLIVAHSTDSYVAGSGMIFVAANGSGETQSYRPGLAAWVSGDVELRGCGTYPCEF